MSDPTYRLLTPDDLWLAGDALPGLLRGWNGLAEQRSHSAAPWRTVFLRGPSIGGVVQWALAAPDDHPFGRSGVEWVRTFCTLPALRDHARRVLLAGERCGCHRGWVHVAGPDGEPSGDRCPSCNGSGYLRKPADIGPIIEAELRGDITPTEAAGLVWCSLLRVAAGMKPARAIVSEYMTPKWADLVMFARHIPRNSLYADGGRLVCIVEHDGWYLQPPHDPYSRRNVPHGPETGDAGKSAADTAALAAGYAIREPGALLMPLPDGVIGRLEVSDAG